jgi:hypothetical protein
MGSAILQSTNCTHSKSQKDSLEKLPFNRGSNTNPSLDWLEVLKMVANNNFI